MLDYVKSQKLSLLIENCRNAPDVDTRVDLLREINATLPDTERIAMPSFITNDFCHRALEILEDRIAAAIKMSGREFIWP